MNEGDEMPETHDCGRDAAAYVLGALEPAEAAAFRRHLENCILCREEVDSLRGVAQALPMAAPQFRAPRRLRRRIRRAMEQEARAQRPARPATRIVLRRWPLGEALGTARARGAFGAAVAAVALAAAVVAGVNLSGGPAAHLIQARVSGTSGSAELRLAAGRGELIVHHLAPPPRGQVYEVWLKRPGGRPRPASVLFDVGPSGGADVGLPESLRGVSQLMVTAEPHGGTQVPTSPPVIVAQLT
jgi:anti-sigma-K factor RskA